MERKEAKQVIRRVVSPVTYDYAKHKGEVNSLPSETVPSEALTIRQIFERFRSGAPLGVYERPGASYAHEGVDADFDAPDLDKLKNSDFVERDEFQERLMDQIAQKQKHLKERRDQETKRRQEEEKEIQALREELRSRKQKPPKEGEMPLPQPPRDTA